MKETFGDSLTRFLAWLTDAACRHHRLFVIAGVLLALVAGAVAASRLEFQASRETMISPHMESYRHYMDVKSRFRSENFLIVVFEVEDAVRAREALDDLAGRLEPQVGGVFEAVYCDRGSAFFDLHGLLYADRETFDSAVGFGWRLASLAGEPGLEAILQEVESGLAGDGGDPGEKDLRLLVELYRFMAEMVEKGEDRGASERFAASMRPEADPLAGLFASPDESLLFAYVIPVLHADRLVQAEDALHAARDAIEATRRRFPGQRIGLTGRPAIEYDEMKTSTTDMTRATVLAFAGVAVLFLIVFRSPARTSMALLALVLGVGWTTGVISVWPGRLTLLSSVFAIILFGIGIDFGIYLLSRYQEERHRGLNLEGAMRLPLGSTGRATLVGAATTVVAFGTALFIDFQGIAELGFIAGVGVLLSFIAMITILPAGLAWVDSRRKKPWKVHSSRRARITPFRGRAVSVAILVAAVGGSCFCVGPARKIGFDENPANLQAEGLESAVYETLLAERTPEAVWFGYSVVGPGELEHLREKGRAFEALPEVGKVQSILDALPGEDQDERLGILRELGDSLRQPLREDLPPVRIAAVLAHLERMVDEVQGMADGVLARSGASAAIDALEEIEEGILIARRALLSASPEEVSFRLGGFQASLDGEMDTHSPLRLRMATLHDSTYRQWKRSRHVPDWERNCLHASDHDHADSRRDLSCDGRHQTRDAWTDPGVRDHEPRGSPRSSDNATGSGGHAFRIDREGCEGKSRGG